MATSDGAILSFSVQCSACGHIRKCPHCNVSLSLHRNPDRLVCHYCGHTEPYDGLCPDCGEPLVPLGAGTQRIEEELSVIFPEARIARLDREPDYDMLELFYNVVSANFTGVPLSAVTAVLNVKMGFIAKDPYAFALSRQLLHEAVTVAHALGLEADEEHLLEEIKETSERVPEGITSICADLSKGRKTEVDTISGSVVRAAKKCGVEVPAHEFLVNMVHAMEDRGE